MLAVLYAYNINHQINQKMNKLLLIYGLALFGGSPIVEQQESTVTTPLLKTNLETTRTLENNFTALNINAEVIEEASICLVGTQS